MQPPSAVIVAPATAALGSVVELDGSQSEDPGGASLGYVWRFLNVPANSSAALNDPTIVNPSFLADAPGVYTVELVVTNGFQLSKPVSADILVDPCGTAAPLIAGITSNPTSPGVGNTVRLLADVSDDDNSTACGRQQGFTYDWDLVGLPTNSAAELNDPSLPSPWFVADASGQYTVELAVTDSTGLTSLLFTFNVTVSTCGEAEPEILALAAAPENAQIDDVVNLSATIQDTDNEGECDAGQTFSYAWSIAAAPPASSAQIQRPTAADAWIRPDVDGAYRIRLVVTDSTDRASDPVEVAFFSGDCGANPPSVSDVTFSPTAPNTGDRVALTAAVEDLDTAAGCGDPALYTYAWQLVALPDGSEAELSRDDIESPTLIPDAPGEYRVRLVVTDSRGLSSETFEASLTASECGSAPPDGRLSFEPDDPVIGQTVFLLAQVDDADLDDGSDTDACTVGDRFFYAWSLIALPPGSLATIISPDTPTAGFVPDVEGDYVVGLVLTDEAGHANVGETELTVTVGADSEPLVALTATPESGLAPLSVAFTCATSAGEAPFEYAWSFGQGSTSDLQNPSFVYTTPGTFNATCTVTDSDGDEAFDSVTIVVEDDTTPQVLVGANPRAGTAPLDVAFTISVVDGNGAVTYAWDFADGGTSSSPEPSHTFTAAGDYDVSVRVTDADGDVGTAVVAIAVGSDAIPAIACVADPQRGIEPLEVFFRAETAGGNAPLAFEWDFDIATGGAVDSRLRNPVNTYASAGVRTARATVTDADGDSDTCTVVVTVDADTVPSVSVTTNPAPALGLTPLVVGFTCATSTGNSPFTYLWDFGDGSSSNLRNPTHTYETGGSFTARCTVTDVNGDFGSATAVVTPERDTTPLVVLSANPLVGFAPLSVTLSSTVDGGNGTLSYVWRFGDSTPNLTGTVGTGGPSPADIQAPSHTFASAGTFQVTLTVADADGDVGAAQIQIAVGVNSSPTVVALAQPPSGTSPLLVQFVADAAGGDEPLTWTWDFGDTQSSTARNPTHTYTYDTFPGPVSIVRTAQVTVRDADGDTDSSTVLVTVFRDDSPDGTVTVTPTTDGGLTPHLVPFTCSAGAGNAPFTYEWDFGDGGSSALQNPTHVFEQGGVFTSTCTVTDSDGDTGLASATITATLDTAPVVNLGANPLTGFAPLTVVFSSGVTGGNGDREYRWNFGNGQTLEGILAAGGSDPLLQTPSFAYGPTDTGTFLVRLTVEDADGDAGTATIQIAIGTNDVPSVAGSATPQQGVEPLDVDFAANIVGGNAPLVIEWDFDFDATNPGETFDVESTALNPSHVYTTAGTDTTFSARVRVTDADLDEATSDVPVFVETDRPVVAVVAPDPVSGQQPLRVDFTCDPGLAGLGNAPLSYAWTFGDGGTSGLRNPVHTYENAGSFTATCTITDTDGDTGFDTSSVTVTPDTRPVVALAANPLSGVTPLTVNFTATVTGGESPLVYDWDFGDSVTAPNGGPALSHVYSAGSFLARVTVTDGDGDVASDVVTISVAQNSVPAVAAQATPSSGIAPLDVQFAANLIGGNPPVTLEWDFDFDGVTFNVAATGPNPSHRYLETGGDVLYRAQVRATDSNDPFVASDVFVQVFSDRAVEAQVTPASVPDPLTDPRPLAPALVAFTCATTVANPGNPPLSFFWEFGDGGTSSLPNPSHTYTSGGDFTAVCTVTDADGDNDDATVAVRIAADLNPVVALSASPLTGVEPLPVTFTHLVTSGNPPFTFLWDFGQGAGPVAGETQPMPVVYSAGTYLARLTVTDADGDIDSDTVQITVTPSAAVSVIATATPAVGAPPLVVRFGAVVTGNPPFAYRWDLDDDGQLDDSTAPSPSFTYSVLGPHTVTVEVIDQNGAGATATDTVDVVVNGAPSANAGPDVCRTSTGLVQVDAIGSTDPENDVLTYAWAFLEKPPGSTATLSGPNLRNPTFVASLTGAFVLRLTVSDAFSSRTDEVTIEVSTTVGSLTATNTNTRTGNKGVVIAPVLQVEARNACTRVAPVVLSGVTVSWTSNVAVLDFASTVTAADGRTANPGLYGDVAATGTAIATAAGRPPVVFNIVVTCVSGECLDGDTCAANGDCAGNLCQGAPTGTCVGPTFVDDTPPGGGTPPVPNGLTWGTAYPTLTQALASVQPGEQIWVAEGTYQPDGGSGDRTLAFELQSGVAIRGGFAGDELDPADRDPDVGVNVTTLSGDLVGDDNPLTDVTPNRSDNSWHVLRVGGGDSNVWLERLTVTGGQADGGGDESRGGGLRVIGFVANLTLTDVIFTQNFADDGGGAFIFDVNGLLLERVDFADNVVGDAGGGLFLNTIVSGVLDTVTFMQNSAAFGGGIASDAIGSELLVDGAVFDNNSAGNGGGSWHTFTNVRYLSPAFIGNSAGNGGALGLVGGINVIEGGTLADNDAFALGGGVYLSGGGVLDVSDTTLELNGAVDGGGLYSTSSFVTLSSTTFRANGAGDTGGGVFLEAGELDAIDVDFELNTASTGGALASFVSADLEILNSTFFNNVADVEAPGLFVDSGTVLLAFVTLYEPSAGAGVAHVLGRSLPIDLEWYYTAQFGGSVDFIFNSELRVDTCAPAPLGTIPLAGDPFLLEEIDGDPVPEVLLDPASPCVNGGIGAPDPFVIRAFVIPWVGRIAQAGGVPDDPPDADTARHY